MGLFGALSAGVSGLDSQSNAISIISNNIANVNTTGYKQSTASFDTLVVPGGTGAFSPGGATGGTEQLVNQQGIISATTSATDVAISGGGLLVVNTKADGTGQTLYTRAGSFTQDADGNFINSDGYYLQGLPLEADGATDQANFQNLQTVQVSQSATGAATATSIITLAANLNSAQAVLPGPGVSASLAGDATNNTNSGTDIIVPTAANGLVQGNSFTIQNNGGQTDTFTYGGFTYGRSIVTGAGGLGTNTLVTNSLAAGAISNDGASGTIKVVMTNAQAANFTNGGQISISGASAINGIAATDINGEHAITSLTSAGGNTTITFAASDSAVGTGGVVANSSTAIEASNRSYVFASTGNILDASTASGDLLGTTGTTPFSTDALKFQIVSDGVTSTFTYAAVPNTAEGQFNSLDTLASAISGTSGLTASVVNGQLYVSATDANQAVTFVNGDATGNQTINPPTSGINWIQELNLTNVAQAPVSGAGSNVFNSLSGLATQINSVDPVNLVASVSNASSSTPTLAINEANPEQQVIFSDSVGNSGGSILKEFGITGLDGTALTEVNVGTANVLTTGVIPITYSPTNSQINMSSGKVTPQYTKDMTIYDAQGNAHTIALNFAKLNTNVWGVEVTAVPASDIQPASADGQIAYGTLTFNGNGELINATGSIAASTGFTANWSNGASPSTITVPLPLNTSTGIIQTDGAFGVTTDNQNGAPVGELTGITIDSNGYVIASFSNGQTQKEFQVPLASVNNPNGLQSISGNAYEQTIASGVANLQFAGTSGVGTFTPSALEQSNVDLSTQLTNLIIAQQAYGANSKLLTVADSLLQELDQIIQ